ncbi:MAG: PD40 domain-containing protein [Kordiimonadaceae bacterium]|nr:PD40 domain-containing protein [Kordiimonadaceae bacterium]MBO6568345.1 PD40 domain-containing protein [Kordiimonadaceae bacterium]MBO6963925.1 PD40 domain-containing protein [Kordiimonadaceae bacterium]
MWQILEFEFDEATNVLAGPEGRNLLEPKPSALLKFFIAHAGRDISRDELIEHVWQGHIVSDGAINRVVVQLRKALNDNEKIKRFIVTVPKVGYRFIVSPQLTEKSNSRGKSNTSLVIGALALLTIVLVFAFSRQTGLPEQAAPSHRVSPLVRLSSEQFGPAVSPDGSLVVFSVRTDQGAELMMADGVAAPPTRIGHTGGLATSATWSPNADTLAYQFRARNSCHIMMLSFTEGAGPASVYECPLAGHMSLAFSKDGQTLYFTERRSAYEPAELFALDLSRRSKRKLSQPTATGRGNHFVDVHPISGKVLLLSDQSAGQTSAFEIDDAGSTFERILMWPYRLDQATWGHDSVSVVHPDMHPSYQLVETDISSGEYRILATESRRIKEPIRALDGASYIYTSYLHNRDIWLNGADAQHLNSSVMDYAPSLSHDGQRVAFVSKRTGQSRVYFDDVAGGAQSSVALPMAGLSIFGLQWSPNNKYMLVASSQGLWVFDVAAQEFFNHHRAPLPIYGASWTGENQISYSLRENRRWQGYSFQPGIEDIPIAHDDAWAFRVGAGSTQYLVSQTGDLFVNGTDQVPLECAPPLYGRHFTYRVVADKVYCPSSNYQQVLFWGPNQGAQVAGNFDVRLGQFSVSNGKAVHTVLKTTSSDIMRVIVER